MLEHGTWLVPTLIIYKALVEEGVEAGMPAHLVEKTWAVLDAGAKALELAYKAGVKIAYGSDLRRVKEVCAEEVAGIENLLEDRPIDVLFTSFGGSSVDLVVRFWSDNSRPGGCRRRT